MKLSLPLLKKICDPISGCTKKEIDAILYLTQQQDDSGTIVSVHWKEIAANVGMSLQKFYDVMQALIIKDIIKIEEAVSDTERPGWGFRDIVIKDNNFMNEAGEVTKESLAKGYLNLDKYPLINTAAFRKFTRSETAVVLYMLSRHSISASKNKTSDIIVTLHKIMEITGKQRRSAKKFAMTIYRSGLLPVNISDDNDLIWASKNILNFDGQPPVQSQADRRNERIISIILKKQGIEVCREVFLEVLKILGKQYSIQAGIVVRNIIRKCIQKFKTLIPGFINRSCREMKSAKKVRDKNTSYYQEVRQNSMYQGMNCKGGNASSKNTSVTSTNRQKKAALGHTSPLSCTKTRFQNYTGRKWDYDKLERLERESLQKNTEGHIPNLAH